MVKIQKGEIFDIPADIRVNTVNCLGVMGAGVALAFKNRYPDMFKDYRRACLAGDIKPGRLHVWKNLEGEWIINFPTKLDWRDPSQYEYIEAGLKSLREFLTQYKNLKVVIPPLGCGLGGLDWNKVSIMIRESLATLDNEIIVLEPSVLKNRDVEGSQSELDPIVLDQLTSKKISIIDQNETDLGSVLRAIGATSMFIKGSKTLLNGNILVIIPSFKPMEKEIKTAISCVEEIARPGVVIGAGYSPLVEREVLRIAMLKGAGTIIFSSEGILNFKVRETLKDAWDDSRVVVVSIAHPQQGWNRLIAYRTRLLEFVLAQSVLITDPSPQWVARSIEKLPEERVPLLFHPKYDSSENLHELFKSQVIGRNPRSGKPNINPILKSLELRTNLLN